MRTWSKDVKKKKMDVNNKVIKASNQRSNCPHGSLIIHQMFRVQMSVATIVTSGMKNPPKKLEFSQALPRFLLQRCYS